MLFADPADPLTLQLPAGWAMDVGSSAPTALVFSKWNGPVCRACGAGDGAGSAAGPGRVDPGGAGSER
jgi:hypothetical protein